VKEKSEGTFFSRLLLNIAKTQINKSEEPKVGASGSSVYADHSEVIQSAQKDKDQLKKLFSQKPNVASTQEKNTYTDILNKLIDIKSTINKLADDILDITLDDDEGAASSCLNTLSEVEETIKSFKRQFRESNDD
jgi:hypothetical protein